ncbi:ankyrin protein 3 [Fusarium heterosporum]|uniref:Ankyrin protein 3 n=1 Tax=Fusarium heterosporum TaxID=42747 RepID=A0A8H5TIR5_FUSHE|nr:ankyrin protein 3 [Fusarium heterosporum]
MSFDSTFDFYQPFGSKGPAQESSKPFSSRVDFSDSSYDMPYFPSAKTSPSKVQNVQTNNAAFMHNTSSSHNPKSKQRISSRDAASTGDVTGQFMSLAPQSDEHISSSHAEYSAFLNSLEFPCISDFQITPRSEFPTSEWLEHDAEFVKWMTSRTRLLWLRGSEGSGKTTLMKQVLHRCIQDEPGSIHLTYSFSPVGSDEPITRLGLFKALLYQLIPQSLENFKDMKARFVKIQSSLPPKQQVAWATQELYDNLVKALPKVLKTHSICIYVDGINYSEGETANKLAQDFSKLVEKTQPSAKEPNAENGLRIIFSSTAYPANDPFPLSYVQVDENNGTSVRRYLEDQLSSTDLDTQSLVVSKAGPSFISGSLIVNHIKLFGPTQSSLIQQPSPTPAPVSFLLNAYFQDMAQHSNENLALLLCWCCLSSRPLALSELRVALALDSVEQFESIKDISATETFTRYVSDGKFQSWIKTTSWGLLETVTLGNQKVVKTIHESVASFFVEKGLNILSCGLQSPENPKTLLQKSHHYLAICLIRYVALINKDSNWESRIHTDPTLQLVKFAGTSWSHHVSMASLDKSGASEMLKLLEWPSDDILQILIRFGQHDPALGDLQGPWAHVFAAYGLYRLLSAVVKKAGKEVLEVQDVHKRTPLHVAALHAHSVTVKQLLKSDANASSRSVNGNTALHFAILQGHQSVLKPLLECDSSLIFSTNDLSQTPLFSGVIRGSSSVIKLLLEKGADIRALDRFKNSLLHHLASSDKSSVLKLILEHGADINWQNTQGHTPLHVAIITGQSSAIKILLENRCRVDIPDNLGRRALHEAAVSGNKYCTQQLLEQNVVVDVRDNDSQTALVYAVQGRHVSIVKLLLESKADVNVKDKTGFNVLMIAVKACEEKMTKLLLGGNPDLDWLSHEGHTVAFYAVLKGKAVSLLSEAEQSIAALLFRSYQKKHTEWNSEWRECQQAFLAEHGKKKDDAINTKQKLKGRVKSNQIPSSKQTSYPHKPKKSSKVTKHTNNTMAKVLPATISGTEGSLAPGHHIKPIDQQEAEDRQPPQATSNTHNPCISSNAIQQGLTGVQEPLATGHYAPYSTATGLQAYEIQEDPFEPYQTTPIPGRRAGQADASVGGVTTKSLRAPQPQRTASSEPKGPIVQRSSWDIYNSLSSAPVPVQEVQAHSAYAPYPGASQSLSGNSANSFRPFEPSSSPRGLESVPRPVDQGDYRYAMSSQTQPKATKASEPTVQKGTPQAYQPFNSSAQGPVPSRYKNPSPYRSPPRQEIGVNSSSSKAIGLEPVGERPVLQQMAERPGQQSPFLPWQPPESTIVAAQGRPQAIPGSVQGKSSVPRSASQAPSIDSQAQRGITQRRFESTSKAAQPLPARPQTPATIPSRESQTQARTSYDETLPPSVAPQSLTYKPQSRSGTIQDRPHATTGGSQSLPGKPQAPKSTAQGRSEVSDTRLQSGVRTPRPQGDRPLHSQHQASSYPSPLQIKPHSSAPTKPRGPTPHERKLAGSRSTPRSTPASSAPPTDVSKPISSGEKNHAWPDHRPEPFSTTQHGYQKSTNTSSSFQGHLGNHTSNAGQGGKLSSGKVAAVASAGILTGAAGGYLLSSQMDGHYSEENIVNNYNYTNYNDFYHQPDASDSGHDSSDVESPAEDSEHSEAASESEHSDDDSDLEGSSDGDVISDAGSNVSYSDHLDSYISSDNAKDTDENESENDDYSSSDSDGAEPDSPQMAADYTDNEFSEAGSDDFHVGSESESDVNSNVEMGENVNHSSSEDESDVQNESDAEPTEDSDSESDGEHSQPAYGQYQDHFQQEIETQHDFQEQYQPQYYQQADEQNDSEDKEQSEEDSSSEQGDEDDSSEQSSDSGNDIDNSYGMQDYSDNEQVIDDEQYGGEDWDNGYESDY